MSTIADQIEDARRSMATWPRWLIPEYVMTAELAERLEILRRIGERGLALSQRATVGSSAFSAIGESFVLRKL